MPTRTIDRFHRPSAEWFRGSYLAEHRPVILTGIADRWPAGSRWTPEFLRDTFPDVELTYEAFDGDESLNDPLEYVRADGSGLGLKYYVRSPMRAFVDRMLSSSYTRTFYCSNWPIFEAIPELRADVGPLDDYMGWLRLVPREARRRLTLPHGLWMGPAGALSMLHFDRAHNLYVQLYGRKRYVMISPAYSRHVHWPSSQINSSKLYYSPVNAEAPDARRFPLYAQAERFEFIIEPGEILFIPVGWWHHVRSLEPAISLSVPWVQPVDTAVTLRRYFLTIARRRVLGAIGLESVAARCELP